MTVFLRAHVQDLVNSTTDPAFAVDDKQRFICWNKAAAQLLSKLRANFPVLPCYKVIRGLTGEGMAFCRPDCCLLQTARTSGEMPGKTLFIRTRQGLVLGVTVTSLVVRATTDEPQIIHVLSNNQIVPLVPPDYVSSKLATGDASASIPPTATVSSLTERQQEVLRLLSAGFTTKAISQRLNISPTTAKKHIDNVLRNLKVHSRLEATLFYVHFLKSEATSGEQTPHSQ